MFYYQFNIGDYASHTRHLSIYEDIAYRRLLDWYYLNEKPIPLSSQDAARLIGMKDRFPDVECVLEEFFIKTDLGWTNKRADNEIAVYKGFSDAGRRGAAKRWAKGGDSPPIAPLIANNNQETITNNQETIIKPSSASDDAGAVGVVYSKAFMAFWDMYPNKKNKGAAFKAFKKIKQAEYPSVKDGLLAKQKSPEWLKDNGQFIPHPATWINARGWEDETLTHDSKPTDINEFYKKIGAVK